MGAAIAFLALPASAQTDVAKDPDWLRFFDNDYYKIRIELRPRLELGNIETPDTRHATAWTMRTRAGIGSKPIYGFSAYAELENSFSLDHDKYFDGVERPNGRTLVADPEETDLNQGYLQYENDAWADLHLRGGRQRIVLDNARFIGNRARRQNEATYDAALAATNLGISGLEVRYAYLFKVHRPFGDEGSALTRDYDAETHLVHLAYRGLPFLDVSVFGYFLDFEDDAPLSSSNSVGFLAHGEYGVAPNVSLRAQLPMHTSATPDATHSTTRRTM